MSRGEARVEGGGVLGRAFVALCVVFFLNGFITAPFSSLFPVYVEADLGRLPLFTGNLRGLMLLLGGLFALVGGRLCDLVGLKPTLFIGLGGSLFYGLVFLSSGTWVLVGLIFFMGLAAGAWSTAGQSYLITSVGAARLGLGGALYFLSSTCGSALGSLVAGLLKESWSFQQIGAGMTAAMLALFALALMLLPPGRSRPPTAPGLALWSAYRPLLRRREVHLLVGLRCAITTFWGMAGLALPLLIYRIGRSEALPAYYAALSLSIAAGCQLLVGFLRDRYGRLWPLVLSGFGVVLSAAGLALFWHSLRGLFVCGIGLTGSAWAVSTLIPSLLDEIAGPGEKHRLVGLGHMVWSAAMLAGSVCGGLLLEVHPTVLFFAGTLLSLGGTLCAWTLCRRLDRAGG